MTHGPTPPDRLDSEFGDFDPDVVRRYWRGELAPAEHADVDRWLGAKPGRRAWYEQLHAALGESDVAELSPAEVVRRRTAIVAAVTSPDAERRTGHTNLAARSRATTRATLPPRRPTFFDRVRAHWKPLVVGPVMVLLAVVAVQHQPAAPGGATATERTYATASGERATFFLPDGSSVILSAQSKLRYQQPFEGAERTVSVEGQAYFAVVANPSAPFVVKAAHAVAHVLGTSFVVRAYPRDSVVDVIVEDGRVALRPAAAPASSGTTLVRGDLGRIDAAGLATVAHDVPVEQYTSWTRGTLTFFNTPLRDVVREMNRWYDVTVVLADSALASSKVTGTLSIHSARDAISDIAAVQHLRAVRRGQVVTLFPAER